MPIVKPEYYLTTEDVYSIYTSPPTTNLQVGEQSIYNPASQARLQAKISITRSDPIIIRSAPDKPGIIDVSRFDRIYVNSDIHSDYRNFISYLKNLNLINIPPDLNIFENPAIPNSENDIYSSRFITDTTWKAHNTLYIIVGDIVDGRRGRTGGMYMEVDDRRGSFDLLLHMFIYNLRLRALEMNSDILFTIGNHDFLTAIKHKQLIVNDNYVDINVSEGVDGWTFYTDQMANYTKMFFSGQKDITDKASNKLGMNNRYDALTMFYSLSPYLFIQIENSDKSNIYFIHSSIAKIEYGFENYLPDIKKYQTHIEQNAITNKFILDEIPSDIGKALDMNNLFYKIWRIIQLRDVLVPYNCPAFKTAFSNSTLIVGHCPTIMAPTLDPIIKNKLGDNNEYDSCGYQNNDSFGCIIPKCFDDFKLILVDTGFSVAFRTERRGEMDKLLKTDPRSSNEDWQKYFAARVGPSGEKRVSEILKIKKSNHLQNFDLFYRIRWNPYTQIQIIKESVDPNQRMGVIPWDKIDENCSVYVFDKLTEDEKKNKKISLDRIREIKEASNGKFDIEDVKSCLDNYEIKIIQTGGSDKYFQKYLKYKKKFLELKKYIR